MTIAVSQTYKQHKSFLGSEKYPLSSNKDSKRVPTLKRCIIIITVVCTFLLFLTAVTLARTYLICSMESAEEHPTTVFSEQFPTPTQTTQGIPISFEESSTSDQTSYETLTEEEAHRQLWQGVVRGDTQQVEKAALQGADLERGDSYWTPLTFAAKEGRLELVRSLLRLGARLETRDGGMETALHSAVRGGRTEVVRLLLEAGAAPGAENKARETPLHLAAQGGLVAEARLLVEAGAEVDLRDRHGFRPLALARLFRRPAVVSYLRSVGAHE